MATSSRKRPPGREVTATASSKSRASSPSIVTSRSPRRSTRRATSSSGTPSAARSSASSSTSSGNSTGRSCAAVTARTSTSRLPGGPSTETTRACPSFSCGRSTTTTSPSRIERASDGSSGTSQFRRSRKGVTRSPRGPLRTTPTRRGRLLPTTSISRPTRPAGVSSTRTRMRSPSRSPRISSAGM
jgi:hypothetical protein